MNSTASAFSSSDTEVLERQIDSGQDYVTLEHIWNKKQQKICLGWLRQNKFNKVCLQFPDHYLTYSSTISINIREQLPEIEVFILADTSYGSCCCDEITAEHVDADSLIHFGNACRSKVSRLPVLYMFPHYDLNVNEFLTKLTERLNNSCNGKHVCIYVDVGYHHWFEENDSTDNVQEKNLFTKIKEVLTCASLNIEVFPSPPDAKLNLTPQQEKDRICIFIGSDNNNFFQLSLTNQAAIWYIYDVKTNEFFEKNPLTAKYIRRRYYYIEKCKDAQVLGLIVATLSADGYLDIVSHLQQMAKSRGKKTQIISVGRINPAKLANFLEIDCFVLIGCPFNNMFENKEFYKPIVSVFEAEMALNPAWLERYPETYVTDFKQLLPEGHSFIPFDNANIPEQDISLINGQLRNTGLNDAEYDLADISALTKQQQALMIQNKMEVMKSNIGLTFEDRTWQGLEQSLGQTEPAKIQKGLSGIPIRYSKD